MTKKTSTAVAVSPAVPETVAKKSSTIHLVMPDENLIMKLAGMDVRTNTMETEDQFFNLYEGSQGPGILKPPYFFDQLWRLSQQNNALQPCIEAMITNIDGTGFEITADDMKPEDRDKDDDVKALWDFFLETYPGESFITLRKKLRRDRATVGNAYMEVLENLQQEVVFLRHMDAKTMRLCKLDEEVVAEKTVKRFGREVKININVRERRYAQLTNFGGTVVYFRDIDATRHLNKRTGQWESPTNKVAIEDRATRVKHFIDTPDGTGPYGVPCWVPQIPSVLGSRKAEEFNMEFFDNGGIPPALILLSGGVLANKTREEIQGQMFVKAAKKQRIMVIESEPTGGSLDSTNTVRMTVERFGTERQNDSMFEKYDDKCEQRVRRSFRLPPIFVGASTDYNFATAYASYTVAEAQVFKPAREEFDEVISVQLIPRFKLKKTYRIRSLPLQIQEATTKLEGIKLAKGTGHVAPKDIVQTINEVAGLSLKASDTQVMPMDGENKTGGQAPGSDLNGQTGLSNGKRLPAAA